MRSFSICGLASALFLLTFASCGDGNPLPEYLKNTWGIQLSGFAGDYEVGADGIQTHTATGKITVDGLGSSQLAVELTVEPTAKGGETVLYVSNLDGSQQRYFAFDQTKSDIEIGNEAKGIAVGRNPDGTYTVWLYDGEKKEEEREVANGFEALRLVEQYNEFKSISPYILLTAFAVSHAPSPEARAMAPCDSNHVATTPVVCEVFKEFCDCAACLVLKRQGACGLCPKL